MGYQKRPYRKCCMNKSITQANEFKTISHLSKTVFNKPDISTYEVWGISPEGFYIGMVPTKYENGKLTISLDTEPRSMYYLIVKN